jgi:glycosyltransferase involved in cell wall biosynthesis
MKILLLEPFFTGSHQRWAEEYQQHSQHEVELLSLRGRHWKWRMQGGAAALAKHFSAKAGWPDLLLATDMLHLPAFLGLTRQHTARLPVALYFHENQITYPWSPDDPDPDLGRDHQYGYINYLSALAADAIFFNSDYHRASFLSALPGFLRQFPDARGLDTVPAIAEKSEVLPLGLDLRKLETERPADKPPYPTLLWNHRWEYDKNPDLFFQALFRLKEEGIDFRLIVLGEGYRNAPPIFAEAKQRLADELLHWGYAESQEAYAQWLWVADILPVTSRQDFFGGSVVEAMYCGCFPILPRRLAYTEHVPEALHPACFYEKDEAFYPLLRKTLVQWPQLPQATVTSDFVARYDWSILAGQYDKRLARVSNKPID